MEDLPEEVTMAIWEKLPIRQILNLCKTSTKFQSICNDPYTWKFLLRRDFNMEYSGYDPKTKYIIEFTKENIKSKTLYLFFDHDIHTSLLTWLGNSREEFYRFIADQYNTRQLVGNKLGDLIIDFKGDDVSPVTPEEVEYIYDNETDIEIIEDRIDGIN